MTGRELIEYIKKYDLEDEQIIKADTQSSIYFTSKHKDIEANKLIINGDNEGKLVEYEHTSRWWCLAPNYI